MSSADEGSAATASRVGADLRAARERLEWSLPAIAAQLRIRLPFLEAIEDGRIRDLPGNAYAVGFVRTYAQALGLDPDEVARRFRTEAADINRKTELAFPAPVPERGVPAGAVVLLGVVLAVGAYVGWYHASGNDRPASEPVQPVPPRLMALAEAPAPPPALPTHVAAAVETPAPAPAPSVSPSSAAAAVPAPGIVITPAPAAPPASPLAASPSGVGPGALPAPDGTRIVLRARADAWLQVRDRQGSVLLNRVMRNGETWPVPTKGQLLLTTGNAGGTEVLVDGIVTASLGNDGAVRRDLPLDPDLIRDGKLALPLASGQAGAKPLPAAKQP
ncbi:helix-turn-helix domain-containing protein [Limobrevibacterium gyesilva]|uniref:Helix-turn-helix domain-containing protein n=1 Tax=Limobrevibacterium gyesilva TaxID=2991712 RepID=A0AA42CCY1_9PROT|nr:helix-turn-helix domain-containing protein [Limobrevibacterium gyesilva]MCW3472954.1 helix-turn-helix domain-containing protein [Limobrevibacterium gyesilva]